MSIVITEIDQGNSTPIVFSDISGNPITVGRIKIAEFGLKVVDPNSNFGSFNFIQLLGSVGVSNPSTSLVGVRLSVYLRNTAGGIEIPIFTLDQTVLPKGTGLGSPNGNGTVSFNVDIGGITGNTPAGYYAVSLYAQFTPGQSTFPAPFVNGPVSFTGTSKTRNV